MTRQETEKVLSIFPSEKATLGHTEYRINKAVNLAVSDYSITIYSWAMIDRFYTITMTSGYALRDIVEIVIQGDLLSIETKTYTGCIIHIEEGEENE